MKKLILILFVFLISTSSTVFAQEVGHRCEETTCLSCNIGDSNCNPGVCTATLCEEDDIIAPFPPVIINTEELKQVQSTKSLRVRGFGETNTRVFILINNKVVHESNLDDKGDFDVTFDTNVDGSESNYELEAYLTDQSNNESDKSPKILITFDTKAPTIEFSNLDDVTGFEKYLVTGKTEPDTLIQAFKDGKLINQTGSDELGEFNVLLQLEKGENKFNIKITDSAENETNQDINIQYDPSNITELIIESVENDVVKIKVPTNISKVNVASGNTNLGSLNAEEGYVYFDLKSQKSNLILQINIQFIGVDPAGNQTRPINYYLTNYALIAVIVVLLVIFTVGLFYLYKTGRIQKLVGRFKKQKITENSHSSSELEQEELELGEEDKSVSDQISSNDN